eukprot:CAMPEP_0171061924 /NCGR_PEP_ID=MMETSP0766_2-20121228/4754_1 /TAXON_ID=439317 /ORGANISM="Gambierdiscus australes, Strain CAWD 149" /LENGTH=205 /DNA_ID=CAMNT_0011517671 /DNA_START=25 /DNA_END=638 /DNA_ORIENTATION=-
MPWALGLASGVSRLAPCWRGSAEGSCDAAESWPAKSPHCTVACGSGQAAGSQLQPGLRPGSFPLPALVLTTAVLARRGAHGPRDRVVLAAEQQGKSERKMSRRKLREELLQVLARERKHTAWLRVQLSAQKAEAQQHILKLTRQVEEMKKREADLVEGIEAVEQQLLAEMQAEEAATTAAPRGVKRWTATRECAAATMAAVTPDG